MNRLIYIVLLLGIIGTGNGLRAQCTPDSSITEDEGFKPDPLPDVMSGEPYELVISFRFPADTLGFEIKSPSINSVTGIPEGIEYACNAADCRYETGGLGCLNVTGTTPSRDEDTTYEVVFEILATVLGQQQAILDTAELIVRADPMAVTESTNRQPQALSRNYPNPFAGETQFTYRSETSGTVLFRVYDLLGHRVHSRRIGVTAGENTIRFERDDLYAGVYFYRIETGDRRFTRRMIITDN